jgi:putative cell wall-binding protein/fibronectin type 3 domain-containing protein
LLPLAVVLSLLAGAVGAHPAAAQSSSTGTLTGTVTGGGQPLEGICVDVHGIGGIGGDADTVTDAGGRYTFTGLARDLYVVTFFDCGEGSWGWQYHLVDGEGAPVPGGTRDINASTQVSVVEGETAVADAIMVGHGRIVGGLTTEGSLDGVCVSALDLTGAVVATAAPHQGSYSLIVPDGDYRVRAWSCDGSERFPQRFHPGTATTDGATVVEVRDGGTVQIPSMALVPNPSVSGRMLRFDGQPAAGFCVWAFGESTSGGYAQVAADGTYTVHGPPGAYRLYGYHCESYEPWSYHPGTHAYGDATRIDISAGSQQVADWTMPAFPRLRATPDPLPLDVVGGDATVTLEMVEATFADPARVWHWSTSMGTREVTAAVERVSPTQLRVPLTRLRPGTHSLQTTTSDGQSLTGTFTVTAPPAYTITTSEADGVPFEYLDTSDGTLLCTRCGDDSRYWIDAPFPVTLFGQFGSRLRVSTNGVVGVGDVTSHWSNHPLPSSSLGTAAAPWWDDLYDPTITTATIGSAPNRRFVVEWSDVQHIDSDVAGDTGRFQVVFAEANQAVLFQYDDTTLGSPDEGDAGAAATIGLNLDQVTAVQHAHNEPVLRDGLAILFTPNGAWEPPVRPQFPTGSMLTATRAGEHVDLSWPAASPAVSYYEVHRNGAVWEYVSGTSTRLHWLSIDEDHHLAVYPVLDDGEGFRRGEGLSTTVARRTRWRDAVSLVATRLTATQVDLAWEDTPELGDVDRYVLRRGSTELGSFPPGEGSYAVTDTPSSRSAYDYRVVAVDASGNQLDDLVLRVGFPRADRGCAMHWTGAVSSDWHAVANWAPETGLPRLPGSGDVVCVDDGQNLPATVTSGAGIGELRSLQDFWPNYTLDAVRVEASTLSVAGDAMISRLVVSDGGALRGGGALTADSVVLDRSTLAAGDTTTWSLRATGAGTSSLEGDATPAISYVQVEDGATLAVEDGVELAAYGVDLRGVSAIVADTLGGASLGVPYGYVNARSDRAAGTDTARVDLRYSGNVYAERSRLELRGGWANVTDAALRDASLQVTAGGTVRLPASGLTSLGQGGSLYVSGTGSGVLTSTDGDGLASLRTIAGYLSLDSGASVSTVGPLDVVSEGYQHGNVSIGQGSTLTVGGTYAHSADATYAGTGLGGTLAAPSVEIRTGSLGTSGQSARIEGNLRNERDLNIYTSRLAVTGTYTQTGDGRLRTSYYGPSSAGRLTVDGAASIAGALAHDSWVNATAGDAFDVLVAGSLTGRFNPTSASQNPSSITGFVGNGLRQQLDYPTTEDRVRILVVDAPRFAQGAVPEVTALSDTSLTVSWPSVDSATSYRITGSATDEVTDTAYTLSGLSAGSWRQLQIAPADGTLVGDPISVTVITPPTGTTCDVLWVGRTSSAWEDAGNWTGVTGAAPARGDVVCIATERNLPVRVTGDSTVGVLYDGRGNPASTDTLRLEAGQLQTTTGGLLRRARVDGGALRADGELRFTDLDWRGGTLTGSGGFRSTNLRTAGTALELAGATHQVDYVYPQATTLTGSDGAVLDAYAWYGGQGAVDLVDAASGSPSQLRTQYFYGTWYGTTPTRIGWGFDPLYDVVVSGGLVDVTGSYADLSGGTLSGARLHLSSGGRLRLADAEVTELATTVDVSGAASRLESADGVHALRTLQTNSGTLRLSSGAQLTTEGPLTHRGGLELSGTSTLLHVGGDLVHDGDGAPSTVLGIGSTLRAASGAGTVHVGRGTLTANGATVDGDLLNGATVGVQRQDLTVTGDYTQGARGGSRLRAEVLNPAGNLHGTLSVGGTATLADTFTADRSCCSTFALGDDLTIVEADVLAGAFSRYENLANAGTGPQGQTLNLAPEMRDRSLHLVVTDRGLAPQWPSGARLTLDRFSDDELVLRWPTATDPEGQDVTYQVRDHGTPVGSPQTGNTLTIPLTRGTTYAFSVSARDSDGNASQDDPTLTLRTAPAGVTCDVRWSGATSDAWSEDENWLQSNNEAGAPGPGQRVCIGLQRNLPVTSTGTAEVASVRGTRTGGGALLHVTGGTLDVGAADLQGDLLVSGASTIVRGSAIDLTGALQWTGGTVAAEELRVGAGLQVSGTTPKTLDAFAVDVFGTSAVSGTGFDLPGGVLTNWGTLGVSGGADMTGDSSVLVNQGTLAVTGTSADVSVIARYRAETHASTTVSTAALDLPRGLTNLSEVDLRNAQGTPGILTGGTWTLATGGRILLPAPVHELDATLAISGATSGVRLGADSALAALRRIGGSLQLSNGAVVTTTEALQTTGSLTLSGSASRLSAGGVTVAGGTTTVDGVLDPTGDSIVDVTGGTLTGTGRVDGPVRNAGTIALGGQLTVDGRYEQTEGGTLRITIGSTPSVAQLRAGTADLDGTLDIVRPFWVGIGADSTFRVLTHTGGTGEFATLTGGPFDGFALEGARTADAYVVSARDIEPPRWPSGAQLAVTNRTGRAITVGWSANPATDNAGVTGYVVSRRSPTDDGWVEVATTSGDARSYRLSGLEPETAYDVRVEAVDAAGNRTTNGPVVSTSTTTTITVTGVGALPATGTAPLATEVRFTAGSEQDVPVAWTIDFGADGIDPVSGTIPAGPAQQVRRGVTYPTKGTYTVTVTLTDGLGNEEIRTFDVIVRNNAPTGSFTLSPAFPEAAVAGAEPVTATILASDADGDALTYRIDWRDGSPAVTGPIVDGRAEVSRTFTRIGTFPVAVEIRDGTDSTRLATRDARVRGDEPLRAVAGAERAADAEAVPVRAVLGEPFVLDGSNSRPTVGIETYRWDVYAMPRATGDTPVRTYHNAVVPEATLPQVGEYEAVLTVRLGSEQRTDRMPVSVVPFTTEGVAVRIVDAANPSQVLSAGRAVYIGGDGRVERTVAEHGDAQGRVLFAGLSEGEHTIYAIAPGFRPSAATATVGAGGIGGEVTIALERGDIGVAEIESRRMTYEEIVAAGIDPSDPANNTVIEFSINIAFELGAPEVPLVGYINGDGFTGGTSFPSGSPGTCDETCSYRVGDSIVRIVPQPQAPQPTIVFIVVPAEAKMLKEFFDVQLKVVNLADPAFSFANGTATLTMGDGLSLPALFGAPQSADVRQVDLPADHPAREISGGETGTFRWVVRGDRQGDWPISASYLGQLEPLGDVVDLRTTTATLKVWGHSALGLTVRVPDQVYEGHEFPVVVELRNVTDSDVDNATDLYNVEFRFRANAGDNWSMSPTGGRDDPRVPVRRNVLAPGQAIVRTYYLIPEFTGRFREDLSFINRTVGGERVTGQDRVIRLDVPPEDTPDERPNLTGRRYRDRTELTWDSVLGATEYALYATTSPAEGFQGQPIATFTINGSAPATAYTVDGADWEPGQTYILLTTIDGDLVRALHNRLYPEEQPAVTVERVRDAEEGDPPPGTAGTPGQFRLTRTGSTTDALEVSYRLSGTAVAGTDYRPHELSRGLGAALIPEGETSVVVPIVPIDDDDVQQAARTVVLEVVETPSYDAVPPETAELSIVDDDVDVSLAVTQGEAVEGGALAEVVLTRTGDLRSAVPVTLRFTHDTDGLRLADYDLTGATRVPGDPTTAVAVLPAGAPSATVRVRAVDDEDVEGDHLLGVELVEDRPVHSVSGDGGSILLVDNDVAFSITVENPDDRAAETVGTLEPRPSVLVVERRGALRPAVVADLRLAGTSVADADDVVLPATVTLPAGERSAVVSVPIVDDALAEGDELLAVEVAGGRGAGDDASRVGTVIAEGEPAEQRIEDNDMAVRLALAEGQEERVPERGTVRYTVTRTGALQLPLDVDLALVAGAGHADADDVGPLPTVRFAEGEAAASVEVAVVDDTVEEADELLVLQLAAARGPEALHTVHLDPSEVSVTIVDDDDATAPSWAAGAAAEVTDEEGQRLTVRWSPPAQDLPASGAAFASGLAGYRVYRLDGGDRTPVGTAGADASSFVVDGLRSGVSYTFAVEAFDRAGNESADGPRASGTTLDVEPPSWSDGAELSISDETPTGFRVTWPEATDNVGVAGYRVVVSGQVVAETGADVRSHDVRGLSPDATYEVEVSAVDAVGNAAPLVTEARTRPDVTAPVWPDGAGLTFTEVGPTSLTFTWPAASDDVGVDGYAILRRGDDGIFRQIGTSSPLHRVFTDTGRTTGVVYAYKVEAFDASGNESTTGPTGSQRTRDVIAPAWPTAAALTFNPVTARSITVSWPAATDNVGVTGYQVWRGAGTAPLALVATTPTATRSHVSSGLEPGTSYTFEIRAVDAAGNVSSGNPQATRRTLADDGSAPTWPDTKRLEASEVTDTGMRLTWTEAQDDVAVTGYRLYRDGVLLATTSAGTRTFVVSGLTPGAVHAFVVEAVDASGNESTSGPTLVVGTRDTVAPTWPADASLTASSVTGTSVTLTWSEATDNVAVAGYRLYRGTTLVGTTSSEVRTLTVTGLSPATSSTFTVQAVDGVGNESTTGPSTSATTLDTVAPTWPAGASLTASSVAATSLTLSWSAATDNLGVAGYVVLRDGVEIGTTSADERSLAVTGLSPGRAYTFEVQAVDAAGNVSADGPSRAVTTADAVAPTWPAGAAVTVTERTYTSVTITWPAATDDSGAVASYRIHANGGAAPVLTVGGDRTTATVTGLTPGTSYTFTVQARDAAGNTSLDGPSVATSTLADTTLPTWPAGAALTFSSVTATGMTITWPEATDDVGVTGYVVLRRNNAGELVQVGTRGPADRSFTDAGLVSSVTYTYKVEAVDAAANRSTTGPQGSQQTLDTVPPTWPAGASLTFSGVGTTAMTVSWPAATDNVAVTGYQVWRRQGGSGEFVQVGTTPAGTRTHVSSGLTPTTSYTFRIVAVDAAANASAPLDGARSTLTPDTTPPSWPSSKNLVERNLTQTGLRLAWTQATDDVAVTGYRVLRGTTQIGSTPADVRVIDVAGLTPDTSYTFTVQAVDAAGNVSTNGPSLTVRTLAPAPGVPVAADEEEVGTGEEVVTEHTIPIGPVTITIGNVTQGGSAVVEQIDGPPPGSDTSGLTLLPTSYDVRLTNVSFDTARVCFTYTDAQVTAAGLRESELRLFHFQRPPGDPSGARVPVDITVSHDMVRNVICGVTEDFSPFAIGVRAAGAPGVHRLSGSGRIETAAAISAASFAPGVAVAYVATAGNFPDALTGGPAAGRRGGPVLLTLGSSLPAATRAELVRLRPGAIVVLGGAGAVPASVEAELRGLTSGAVTRLSGRSRFDTAAAISAAHFDPGVPVVYVATGGNFPDALAGGPAAFAQGGPVLLVERNGVPQATLTELQRLRPGRVVILGGAGAVSDAVAAQLRALVGAANVSRVSGSGRYDTAAAISRSVFTATGGTVFVATGGNFPDALAGAPAAAGEDAPLLLVDRSSVPQAIAAELTRLAPRRIVILGGAGAVSAQVQEALGGFIRR